MENIGRIGGAVYEITADPVVYQCNGWPENIPALDKGQTVSIMDGRNDSFVVQVEQVGRIDLLQYIELLQQAGYCIKSENHIAGNDYFLLDNGTSLINAYYIEKLSTIRITAEFSSDFTLETHGDCIVQPAIFSSSISDRSYFIRLPDNTLVIIDGGWRIEDWTAVHHDKLMTGFCNELRQILGTEQIHVRAWFITHPHLDHTRFLECARNMGYAQYFTVDRIIFNIPSEYYLDTLQIFTSPLLSGTDQERNYIRLIEKELYQWNAFGTQIIKARTGMKFSFAGMEFEILMTPDDTLPDSFENTNGMSLLIRQKFWGQSILWMGDMADKPSKIAVQIYGENLKCDGLQISHHGWGNAGVKEFYQLCSPTVQFWTNSEYGFRFFDQNQGYGKTDIATYVFNMPCTKRHVFCSQIQMEKVTFPLE